MNAVLRALPVAAALVASLASAVLAGPDAAVGLEKRQVVSTCDSIFASYKAGDTMSEQSIRDWIRFACYTLHADGIGAPGTSVPKQSDVGAPLTLLTTTHSLCGADSQCASGSKCWMCPAGGWNCGTDGYTACNNFATMYSVGGSSSTGSKGGVGQWDHDQCGQDYQCASGYSCWKCNANGWNCGTSGANACQWNGLLYSVGGKSSGGSTGGKSSSDHDNCGSDNQCASGYKCWKCPANGWNCGKDGHTACQYQGSVTSVSGSVTAASPVVAVAQAATSSSSSGGGTQYSGRATYYNTRAFGAGGQTTTGVGSCGTQLWDTDYVAALNSGQYSSSWCGKRICVTNPSTGKSTTVTVLDLCPECPYGALDLTPAAFGAINNGVLGMLNSVNWRDQAC